MLEKIQRIGSPGFQATATEILSGERAWTAAEIDQFLNSYLNDPYLTRNSS